jgi:hypothetical protein
MAAKTEGAIVPSVPPLHDGFLSYFWSVRIKETTSLIWASLSLPL